MKWPQAGSRANKLAAGVDGAPVAGSLDSDTAALVSLAARLRDIESPVISAEYSADLRLRLLQAAPDLIGSADAVISDVPRQPRRLRARTVRLSAATTAVVLAAGTGVGYASTSALPGGPLYPVKRTIEGVQLAVARSNLDKGYEHLSQASTRLTEVVGLSDGDQSPYTETLIEGTLDDFSVSAQAGAELLIEAYDGDDQGESMERLHRWNQASVAALRELGDEVPTEVQEELVIAAMSVKSIDTEAVTTCAADCAEPVVEIPGSLVTLAPEIVESGAPEILTPTPETVGSPTTTPSVTTVPGSIPVEVTTPGGPAVAPPGDTAPVPTDVPPSVSGTAPAPTTEVPQTTEPLPPTDPTPTEAPNTPDAPSATPDPPSATPEPPSATPDPPSATPEPPSPSDPPTTDESMIPDTTSPLISDPASTASAPTSVPQLSTDQTVDSQAPTSTVTTTLPSGFSSGGSPRPLETSTAPIK